MKKFQVENRIMNVGQIEGYAPHDELLNDYIGNEIEAETAEEAITLAIDYLVEQASSTVAKFDIDYDNGTFTTYDDDGTAVEKYYDFTATEI